MWKPEFFHLILKANIFICSYLLQPYIGKVTFIISATDRVYVLTLLWHVIKTES